MTLQPGIPASHIKLRDVWPCVWASFLDSTCTTITLISQSILLVAKLLCLGDTAFTSASLHFQGRRVHSLSECKIVEPLI